MRLHIRTILTDHWIFITILALAAFLRLLHFQSHIVFLGDQGRDVRIMRDLLLLRNIPAIGPPTSIGQIYSGPFFYYLMSPFLLLFGFNPIGPAYGTLLLSLIGLTLIYAILLRTAGKPIALMATGLIATSWVNIMYSRFSWNPNLMPFFSFLLVSTAITLYRKPSVAKGVLFGAMIGLALQLHYLVGLIIMGLLAMYCIAIVRSKRKWPYIQALLTAVVAGMLVMAPFLLFELKHSFMNTNNLFTLFQTIAHGAGSMPYGKRLGLTVAQGVLHFTQLKLGSSVSSAFFWAIMAVAAIKAVRMRSSWFTTHLFLIIIFFIGFAFIDSPRFAHYYGAILPSMSVVLAALIPWEKRCIICKLPAFAICALIIGANLFAARSVLSVGDNQIQRAYDTAQAIGAHITRNPYQITTIPTTETDDHYRYYLERLYPHYLLLDKISPEQPEELFILCFEKPCRAPVDDNQWAIASFKNKQLLRVFPAGPAAVYQLVHGRDKMNE